MPLELRILDSKIVQPDMEGNVCSFGSVKAPVSRGEFIWAGGGGVAKAFCNVFFLRVGVIIMMIK